LGLVLVDLEWLTLGLFGVAKQDSYPESPFFLTLHDCILPEGKSTALEIVSPGGNPFGQLATFYLCSFFHFSLSWSYFW